MFEQLFLPLDRFTQLRLFFVEQRQDETHLIVDASLLRFAECSEEQVRSFGILLAEDLRHLLQREIEPFETRADRVLIVRQIRLARRRCGVRRRGILRQRNCRQQHSQQEGD